MQMDPLGSRSGRANRKRRPHLGSAALLEFEFWLRLEFEPEARNSAQPLRLFFPIGANLKSILRAPKQLAGARACQFASLRLQRAPVLGPSGICVRPSERAHLWRRSAGLNSISGRFAPRAPL